MELNSQSSLIVVDESSSVRQMMVSVFKTTEAKVQGLGSIKDTVSMLEVEKVDWIICPLYGGANPNALQLLALITKYNELKKTRLSIIVSEEEFDILPYAFEKGLFSFFKKPFTKESLKKSLDEFLEMNEKFNSNDTKISATYLREYLIEKSLFESVLILEKNLLKVFTADTSLLLGLALAYAKTNTKDKAAEVLSQVLLLNDELENEVSEMVKKFELPEVAKNSEKEEKMNVLAMAKVMVLSSKEGVCKEVEDLLKQLGVPQVETFENAEGASVSLNSGDEPDLILLDWQMEGEPAPSFLQNAFNKFPNVSVVIVAEGLTNEDKELLKEIGIYSSIDSFTDQKKLLNALVYVAGQNRNPSEISVMESKIRAYLSSDQYDEAVKIFEKYKSLTNLRESRKKTIEAEFAYANKQYSGAIDLCVETLQSEVATVTIMNLLGKCFIKLLNYEAAMKCFDRANKISPKNIERLCRMAIAKSAEGKIEDADSTLDKAKDISEESEKVKEADATIAVVKGEVDYAKEVMQGLMTVSNVVAYLNNQAVVYAKSGEFEKGLQVYEDTISSIPPSKKEMQALVFYNKGLAYIRNSQLEEAKLTFDAVLAQGESRFFERSKIISEKVQEAIKNGRPVILNSGGGKQGDAEKNNEKEMTEEEKIDLERKHEEIIASLSSQAGDYCCLKIFINPEKRPEKIGEMIASQLAFKTREKISREVTGGLEKAQK